MDYEWCKNVDKGLPRPDIVFYLTVAEEALQSREGFGNEIYEKMDIQRRVKLCYDKMKESNWIEVNGEKNIDDVTEELIENFKKESKKFERSEIARLWWP